MWADLGSRWHEHRQFEECELPGAWCTARAMRGTLTCWLPGTTWGSMHVCLYGASPLLQSSPQPTNPRRCTPLPAPTPVLLGSTWVDHTKSKPIANKLTNYLLTGTLDGKPGEDGE